MPGFVALGDRLSAPVGLDELGSRKQIPVILRTHMREDPYFTSMFDVSARAAWAGRDLLHRELEAGRRIRRSGRFERGLQAAAEPVDIDPYETILEANWGGQGLRALAVVNQWRTVTLPQLAAFTGWTRWAKARWPSGVDAMFATGLIQVGELASVFRQDLPTVLRVDPDGSAGPLLDRLSFRQWLGVTSGLGWVGSVTADRHNILTSELALRIAQFCPGAGAVLGELIARHSMMAGLPQKRFTRRRADAVVVRKDGLRIAVEMTASDQVGPKVENWLEMLIADHTKSTSVLFVTAARPGYTTGQTIHNLYRSLEEAVTSSMSAMAARVFERIYIARWEDWFPGPGKVRPEFAVLPATRYVGTGPGQPHMWERVDLLDPTSVRHTMTEADRTLLANTGVLWGCPKVLTERIGEMDVSGVMLDQAGLRQAAGV